MLLQGHWKKKMNNCYDPFELRFEYFTIIHQVWLSKFQSAFNI